MPPSPRSSPGRSPADETFPAIALREIFQNNQPDKRSANESTDQPTYQPNDQPIEWEGVTFNEEMGGTMKVGSQRDKQVQQYEVYIYVGTSKNYCTSNRHYLQGKKKRNDKYLFFPSRVFTAARAAFSRLCTVTAGSGASLRSLYRAKNAFSEKRLLVVRASISPLKARTYWWKTLFDYELHSIVFTAKKTALLRLLTESRGFEY